MDERKVLKLLKSPEYNLLDYKTEFYNPKDKKSKTDFVKIYYLFQTLQ
ncbi:hypothetical protein M2105_001161 [Paenibacillus sp. PastF-1]|nr:hypothetical protein [Paenibacillus sp. PastF-2]MDF9846331.1 hypothetical protein [Paenibacillus sp. PastM-2]MDF9853319.1 hypothetical protein [Paenibacillus sp. PastF-1]MDH6478177.1 hypothetical protein [Paenibacillus sp. PastH-2]MDH6506324.1 hypothetical protein [Paenibacillus sp. PastM-3]